MEPAWEECLTWYLFWIAHIILAN